VAIPPSSTDSECQLHFCIKEKFTDIYYRWNTETFVSSYINIPIFIILYFGYKLIKKSKIIPLTEIPIQHFIDIANANPEPPAAPKVGWHKLNILWE
jgi:amino acid transporter